jgi:cell wall-associated NlpC family hydrolase
VLATELLARARRTLRQGTTYRLGAGAPPHSPTPADDYGACDCSGFVLWAFGVSRYQPNFQFLQHELGHCWLNTDGIVCDARHPTGYFSVAARPHPSDIIIYPGNYYAKLIGWQGKGPRIGHVGIVTETNPDGTPSQIIHCSSGNMKTHGDAIAETTPDVFQAVPYTSILRFSGIL